MGPASPRHPGADDGDPARAAALYEQLLEPAEPGLLANLGLARMLLGDPAAPRMPSEHAAAAEPRTISSSDLAQARWLQGRKAEGKARAGASWRSRRQTAGEDWRRPLPRPRPGARSAGAGGGGDKRRREASARTRNGQAAFEDLPGLCHGRDHTAALVNAGAPATSGSTPRPGSASLVQKPLRCKSSFRRLASPSASARAGGAGAECVQDPASRRRPAPR